MLRKSRIPWAIGAGLAHDCGRWLAVTAILALLAWPVVGTATPNPSEPPPTGRDLDSPSVVYVDAAAGNDGPTCGASTGTAACKTIGYALAQRVAVSGTVSVAAGTYTERITLRPGITVQGAGAGVTTLDGGGGGPVVTVDDAAIGATTVLAGFTITGGNAEKGGGLRIVNGAAPLIENNIVRNNTAGRGGGIYADASSPLIRNNTLRDNTATVFGGAIHTMLGAARIEGNTIEANTAEWGGGLMVDVSAATVSGNTIRGNTATAGGGGLLIYGTGLSTISNNLIENNHSSATEPMGGGGLNIGASTSPVVTGNVIRNNTGLAGGGINFGGEPQGGVFGSPAFHGNVLCGNEGYQFYNETTNQVDVTGNWWGTNAPGAPQFYGPATYSPAIVMSLSASPATMIVPGASTVQARLQGGGYTVPNGTLLAWSATLGTLNPVSSATTDGVAQTSLSSAAVGTASVTAADPCGFTLSTTVSFVAGQRNYLPILAR